MNKRLQVILVILLGASTLFLLRCGGGGGDGESYNYIVTSCPNTPEDSQQTDPLEDGLINSAENGDPTFHQIPGDRTNASNVPVTLKYMVHEAVGTPKNILLVLIAGGQLDAGITGDGSNVTGAGSDILVRSAHLIAQRGYRVMTIDRPSDYADFLAPAASTEGYALDVRYRTQTPHAVDLSSMINDANKDDNYPVILVGSDRGAISAVAQYQLGAAISISSPVTSGADGDPISLEDAKQVHSPAHVLWHVEDSCSESKPDDTMALIRALPDSGSSAVKGGFETDDPDLLCGPVTYHSFLGIENCAVDKTTNYWVDKLASLPASRPGADSVYETTDMDTQIPIDLTGKASGIEPLTYSLPHTKTSKDGDITINPGTNIVTYTPPTGVSGTTDTFVYVVTDANGGTSNNVVSVTINNP